MDLANWLDEIGLGKYAEAFEDNHVDGAMLRRLTEADLIEIGVKSVGHRRKLVDAIAALPQQDAAAPYAIGGRPSEAEQRQLSVLYCQLAGVASPAPHLDPEVLRDVVQRFHGSCIELVAQYEGHVANFYGDCMLVYFGWPQAHEDDAERAVHAGLALVRKFQTLATASGEPMGARVGIATGPVVVGDLFHEGPAHQQSAVGVTPNLAARVLGLAVAGKVVIDEATRRLAASSFLFRSLGSHALKGIVRAVDAHEVVCETVADSRFDARRRDILPMVGRDQELALLRQRWRQAQEGEGTAVLLVGEAGMGKSRIARALLDACAQEPHWRVRWQCSPHHVGSALWPVIQQLGREASLQPLESDESALDKLEAVAGPDQLRQALYATLLGLNGSQRYGPLEMNPQMLRERTLEVLTGQMLELSEQRPMLLVVEDAQWIDPTTLELIERLLEALEQARMLILVISRPDNPPALSGQPSVTRLSLNRLARVSVEAMVAQLDGSRLQAHTREAIVAQTDGVPLFVEELTKAVLETGAATVPASLHGSLMARLDRLPEVKEVAQVAACIGREFDAGLLQAVHERPEAVPAALDKLMAAGLVFRRGERAVERYTFKHALVQEVACESLLRSHRQGIHARILQVLEDRNDMRSEILAHHAERARRLDKAIEYWSRAGDAAKAKSAYAEAAGHFRRAIALIREEAGQVDRCGQELRLQLQMGHAWRATQGQGSQDAQLAYERAYALLEAAPDQVSHRFTAQYGMWVGQIGRGELRNALNKAAEALSDAHAGGAPEALMFGHRLVASSYFYLGEFEAARRHFEQALGLVDFPGRAEFLERFAVDPAAACLIGLAMVRSIQGHAYEARQLVERARGIESTITQVLARAIMHLHEAVRAMCVRDRAGAVVDIQLLADLSAKHRLPMYRAYASCLRGWLEMSAGGSADKAVDAYEWGLAHLAATGTRLYAPVFMAGLALALADAGRLDKAADTIQSAIAVCQDTSQGWCEAELWRVRGQIASHDRETGRDESLRCLERAVSLARTQGARLWELRAVVSLGRLQSDPAQALDLLAPVYASFTEGFDTPDLAEASVLLSGEALNRR